MQNAFQNCICLIDQTAQSKCLSGVADMSRNKSDLVQTVGQQGGKGFVMHRDAMSLNPSSQIS